jgi:selenide,water dikinase
VLTTAAKRGAIDPSAYRALVQVMSQLNAEASRAALAVGARCATDITGFGLLGHASHIARASGVTLAIQVARVPVLAGARETAASGVGTGGAERNEEFLEARVEWGAVSDVDRALLVDPQTSGGLLVAIPERAVSDYLSRVAGAVEVGVVRSREAFDIVLS